MRVAVYKPSTNLGCAGVRVGRLYADVFREPYLGLWMSWEKRWTLRLNLEAIGFRLSGPRCVLIGNVRGGSPHLLWKRW